MERLTEQQIRKLERLELETIHYRQTGRGREFLFKAIRDAVHALSTKCPDSIHDQ